METKMRSKCTRNSNAFQFSSCLATREWLSLFQHKKFNIFPYHTAIPGGLMFLSSVNKLKPQIKIDEIDIGPLFKKRTK